MNQIMPFQYDEKQVRTIVIDGEPWFVARDICDILELGDTGRAVSRLEDDECTRIEIDHPQNAEKALEVYAVNESGLYSLVLGSRKPEAKAFKRWITHEVLPTIRRDGMYSLIPKTYPEALRAYADEVEKRQLAEAKVAELTPKAEFFDAVADSKDAFDIGSAAKVLNMGIGRNRLFEFLRDKQVLMENNQPYQRYVDRGYFRTIEQKYIKPDGSTQINIKTLVYQKGLDFIRKLLSQPA